MCWVIESDGFIFLFSSMVNEKNAGLQTKNCWYSALQSSWLSSSLPALSLQSWRVASESWFSYPSSIPLCLGDIYHYYKKNKNKRQPSIIEDLLHTRHCFCILPLWNSHKNHDRYGWGSEQGSTSPPTAWFYIKNGRPADVLEDKCLRCLCSRRSVLRWWCTTTHSLPPLLTAQHSSGHFRIATTVQGRWCSTHPSPQSPFHTSSQGGMMSHTCPFMEQVHNQPQGKQSTSIPGRSSSQSPAFLHSGGKAPRHEVCSESSGAPKSGD